MDSPAQVSCGEDAVTAVCAPWQRRWQSDSVLHFRCSEVQHSEPSNMTRQLSRPRFGRTSRSQRGNCYQPSKGDRKGTQCPTKRDGQATAVCSQESTAMGRPTRVKTQTCAWQVGGWWRTRAPGSPSRCWERCRSSSKTSTEQSSSDSSCSCASHVRLPNMSRIAV